MAQSSYFPLRWESTGDQWWYASPIDWAAANGHYDVVRELLHLDANLLIKLTSLRRIRRLETVWDDDSRFADAAKCRAFIARSLLLECETKNRKKNTLIRAGYGGWLLYTAAAAGDMGFVQELLDREPLLVFGEGEFGVTDIFYAAARSKDCGVFRVLLDSALSPAKPLMGGAGGGGGEIEEERGRDLSVFQWDVVNRAVHAAARGGNMEMLRVLLGGCLDVLAYRDVQGSTVLHAAAGRGQVEVVKDLVTSFDMINSRDNHGNTSLHVAAFRGHLAVVDALLRASPPSASLTNNTGDTFLHMAVAGFRTPGFRRLDRQMELIKQLIRGTIVNIQVIVNFRNNYGKTVLHLAVIGNVHPDLVQLLMTIPSIDLNIRDVDGMTPLDLLSQRPRTGSSEILIKQLKSAGGRTSNLEYHVSRSAAPKMQCIGNSPGTSFKIPDSEIFLYTGIVAPEDSQRTSSCSSTGKNDIAHLEASNENHESFPSDKKRNSVNRAVRRLKAVLGWPRRKEKKNGTPKKLGDGDSMESLKKWSEREDTPTPLRQRFSRQPSILNNKRTLSVRNSMPSPATKKKFTAGLMHGVIQAMPHLASSVVRTPSSDFSKSSMSSPVSDKQTAVCSENENGGGASCSNSSIKGCEVDTIPHKSVFANSRLMNQYFCFGAQGVRVGDSIRGCRSTQSIKRSTLSVA